MFFAALPSLSILHISALPFASLLSAMKIEVYFTRQSCKSIVMPIVHVLECVCVCVCVAVCV